MATGQGSEEVGRKKVHKVGRRGNQAIKDISRRARNKARKIKYHEDSEHRVKIQKAARETYRKKNPRSTDITKGLKVPATKREVLRMGDEEFEEGMVTVQCYTLTDMALALGKTRMTLRTWVKSGVLPQPVLRDENVDRFKYYSLGEVKIINRVLNKHFMEFDYLAASHETTIHQLWQEIEGYRREYV